MDGEHVPNKAPALHRGDEAVAPMAADHHFFIPADVVRLAQVHAGVFRVMRERATTGVQRIVWGDPLAGEVGADRVMDGRGGDGGSERG